MIWFGAVGFGGQPGQPKPPTPWNDWRILKSSDKKTDLITTLLPICVFWDQPRKPYQIRLGRFFRLGAQKLIQPTTWSRSQTSNFYNAPLAFVSAHPSFNPFFCSAQPNPNHTDSKKAIRSRASPNPRGKIQNSLLPRPVCFRNFLIQHLGAEGNWLVEALMIIFSWQLGGFRNHLQKYIHIHQMKKKKVAFTKDPEASQNYDQQLPGSFLFLRWGKQKRTTRRNLLGLLAPPEPCALDLPPSGRRFEKMDEHEKCWNHDFLMAVYHIYIYTYICVCVFP